MTVPNHKEIAKGTLRAIIRETGLTVESRFPLDWRAANHGLRLAVRDAPRTDDSPADERCCHNCER